MKISSIKDLVDTEFKRLFIHKAYIEFYFDSQHRECILKPLERIPLVLRIKSLQQSFILNKVDHYLHGKPVFKLIYGYPLAVQSSFSQTTKEVEIQLLELDSEKLNNTIIKLKDCLINSVDKSVILQLESLKGKKGAKKDKISILNTHILEKRDLENNTSFELDTWIQTGYNNVLLKKKMLDLQVIAVWLMTILCTILATWLVADNYMEAYYREKYNPKKGSLLIPFIENNSLGVLLSCLLYLMI